ncbi:ABC-type nitrate/sulfonate/bicarbonate transport system substrate-binding protein [Pseudochelatococcus lubricantis]|uniref:ABC-type nitrate/sulfonate/bicarbonate transport system substrate-binding protein n=1 Tax=Pseudochelatococcus lubricantis TaxID=1538102 RepID=A0ABX0V1G6_9HYPH|nr:ABC transporter substrate-binding protein [Pseudochelatococcus lubricantis]NIJ59044.1 ABC-type nitrate/sulfonate/bicarbonate transport system substrate-binding protein [Pseudochelatococcus lubricantis]
MTFSFRKLGAAALLAAGLAASGIAPAFAGTSASPADASDPYTFRFLPNRGSVSPHELAEVLGYYEPYGIKLENKGFAGGGPETLFALAGGSIDLGSAATSAVLNSIAGGNDFLIAYPSNGIKKGVESVFYVLEDSPIKTIEDLKGKTISVNTLGAHLDYTIREAFHQKGLPPKSAKLVVVPGPQLEQTLRAKQVDVAGIGYWQTTFGGQLEANGGVRPIFTDTDVLGELAGGFVVFRRDFAEAHPKAARYFVEGAARAADWARENPEEARKVVGKLLDSRGEDGGLAKFWLGFGLQPGAPITDRDVGFWVEALSREGTLPAGKINVSGIIFRPASAKAGN